MRVGPFAFRYQGNGATPYQYIDTTRKAIDCATTLREYRPCGSSWALEREKKDKTEKKSQKGYISPIWAEAHTQATCVKKCVDVITCAKFQNEIFWGYDFTGGIELSIFLQIFEWALQQCNIAALLRCLCSAACDTKTITGSAVALHCCKAHSHINRKMENPTPCKMVTPENFILKLGTRD